jgi:hypothetical protein
MADIPQARAIKMAKHVIAEHPNKAVFVKWTCPQCKERVICAEPNAFYTEYVHEKKDDGSKCGAVYSAANPEYLLVGLLYIESTGQLGLSVPNEG